MQAHICSYTYSQILRFGQKVKRFFLKVVMLHIKLKEMERKAPCKHLYSVITHTLGPRGRVKVKTFFLNVVMLHIKLKGKKYRPT